MVRFESCWPQALQQARCIFEGTGERRPRQAGIDRHGEDELDLRSMVEDLMSDYIHGVKKRASKMTARHKPSCLKLPWWRVC